MTTRRLAAVFVFLWLAGPASAQEPLLSPSAFLGYELGTQFTPHHRVVDYVEYVAGASPNVQLERYGQTYEGRPLMVAQIAAPDNLARLNAIRKNNLRRAGMLPGDASEGGPALVWLSYNVHGNESVGTEAAMAALYALADPQNTRTQPWLEGAVVLLDPCVNPDGRARYVQWYKQMKGRTPNAQIEAREHEEPWPGGRMNHYYFDLNRDLAWGTQQETRQRLALYNRWLPHVHVDFHEQSINAPYYFAPAAEPFHPAITDFQRSFQQVIGQNNARYFDEQGWLYFTKEIFDLFYPGYGDTWPLFNGAIGMTYEQGGSGAAGLAVETVARDTLTLADRIAHHFTTSLATVEVAARERARLTQAFADYYADAQSGPNGPYEAYLVKTAGREDRARALAGLLDVQGIRYGYATRERRVRGFDYETGRTGRAEVAPGDLVVSLAQPKGTLAKVLFEPRPTLTDSLTYDITAWALPYAYGLGAYALTERLEPDAVARPRAAPPPAERRQRGAAYAYLAEWRSLDDARLLAALLQKGVTPRVAAEPFETEERAWPAGTLIIPRAANEDVAGFDRVVRAAADSLGQPVVPAQGGFVTEGADFGSDRVPVLEAPRVAVLAGEGLSPYSVGEVWHFFDRRLGYPATLMHTEDFDPAALREYDVLILPSGRYAHILPGDTLEAVREWVGRGGRLVALGRAVSFLAGKGGFSIQEKEAPDDTTEASGEQSAYADRQRAALSENVPGSIFRVEVDTTHPLAFGLGPTYFALKRSDAAFALLEDDWNVGVLGADAAVSGFTGAEAKPQLEDTLGFGVQDLGGGRVVYLVDDPLFRGFWQAGALLFSNAVFMTGAE